MSIPNNITGTDMKGIIELLLINNSVIPIIDNTQPVMISTVPVILFRFIVYIVGSLQRSIIFSCFNLHA